MRNLYGTRSIVPNNYSFTFDKIYYEEVPTTQNDGILIGRSVLYHPDKTVYLKTADGYKQIAKLDNTERLIRNEGMVLLPEHNVSSINYLSGDGATYNGDGLYILNYEDLKTESDGEAENSSYKKVSTNSAYDANIIYFTKNDQKQYVQTICRNNYKTIEKENDSIYCNYFVTGSDNNYLYPLYVLEDNSFQNISQDNLFYKNKDVKDCGFIPDFTGKTFIYLKELKLMKESDSGTYYLTTDPDQTEKHTVSHNNTYYYYEEQKNVYKKVSAADLEDKTDYYINNNSFSLVSSAPEGTKIETKYEQYIYYLYQTTDNGATRIQGYFIYSTEKGQDSPYVLINNNDNYVNNRKKGILYFLLKDDENNIDSWPSIRGIPKEDYLKNSVFLLEQRSNKIIEEDEIAPQKDAIIIYTDQSKLPNNVPNLYCYTIDTNIIKEKALISNTAENWHLAKAAGEKKSIGVPGKLNVEMYQILTDITMYTNNDDGKVIKGKQDKDTGRKELYHDNKTFIRKGKRVYKFSGDGQGAIDEDTSQVFYKYDPADRHGLIEVPKNSNLSDTSIYIIDKDSSSWGEWEDITEQYTGYIGDLDPNTVGFMSPADTKSQEEYVPAQLPYNKHTQYYIIDNQKEYKSANIDQVTFDNSFKMEDNNGTISWNKKSSMYYVKANANRGNLNNSNTLVEATNTLDEIIGSKTRLYGTQVNQITQGSLSKALAKDYRPYSIPEDDIMDTLVHHDADIGAIENLSNIDIKDENGNIIVSNNTYNLTFTKQNEQPDNINSSNNNTVNVRSLTDSTIKTDNMIGYINRLGIKSTVNGNGHEVKGITGTGNTKEDDIENNQIFSDARPYNIPETNIIDTLVHHDADIGAIEDLKARQGSDNNTNNLNFTTAKDPTDTDKLKGVNDIQSIKDALIVLDNLIGARRRLSDTTLATNDTTLINSNADSNDKRPVNIPENNIIDSIIHHDADIGEIEKLDTSLRITDAGEIRIMNNNNLIYSSNATNQKIRKEDNEWKVAEIRSLTDAIEALDKIIGPITGFNGQTVSGMIYDSGNTIDRPYDANDTRFINIPDPNIIYAIGHHDADIGAIENISQNNTNNLNFVNNGSFSNLNNKNNQISDINSLTEAIIKEDNMVGYIGRLGQLDKDVSYTEGTQGVTGTGNKGDIRPYSIPETTVIDTLVHHDADIGAIELLNGANIKFTKTTKTKGQKESHHEIHSLTDAITILDNIIGNYDGIEKEDNSNLKEKNADLVTAINHLSNSIVGYKSGLENKNNLIEEEKRATLVAAINALNTILGEFDKVGTNNLNLENITTFISAIKKLDSILGVFDVAQTNNLNDTENIKTFMSAIKKLDTLLGTINAETIGSESVSKQIQSINSSISKINAALEEYQITDLMSYIKNLAENVDVLDVTIHNIMNEQSLMEWGTF